MLVMQQVRCNLLSIIKQFLKLVNSSELHMSQPQKTKYYCCLYHFAAGKKEKSSTACYNHVPLGVINPIPTSVPRSPRKSPDNLSIPIRKHEINNHTHDLNEIQNKQSLPKRLTYPRVYVEQINPKYHTQSLNALTNYQVFLKRKDFQEIFLKFKRFSKLSQIKDVDEVIKSIKRYAREEDIDFTQTQSRQDLPQHFFKHKEFVNYLVSFGFQDEEAEQFWQIAYNRNRFNESTIPKPSGEVISMRAFAYNYKKFYLDQMQSYRNCLSESALRQRMIDLRLFLQPWFNSNIIFKENHQHWKEIQLEICADLKRFGQQNLYSRMITTIEMRNKIWLFMRTLSKMFYQETDQKNIGLQIFNQRATDIIQKNRQNLQAFVEFMQLFESELIAINRSKDDKFKITTLLQFAKKKLLPIEKIIVYLRGLFKYLYFFNKSDLLSLNRSTLNLDCNGLAEISYNEILEFVSYKRKETNHLMEMIESICMEANETVDARPDINGHRKFLNQCNYLYETLLKMVKRCDFTVFYRLKLARQLYLAGDVSNVSLLRDYLEGKQIEDKEISAQIWKKMFSFEERRTINTQEDSKDEVHQKNYISALQAYQQLKQKLEGKLPKGKPKSQKNEQNNEKESKKDRNSQKSKGKNANASEKQPSQANSQAACNKDKNGYNSCYCSQCDDICSTSMASSLNKIDEMSTYLMDLLRDI